MEKRFCLFCGAEIEGRGLRFREYAPGVAGMNWVKRKLVTPAPKPIFEAHFCDEECFWPRIYPEMLAKRTVSFEPVENGALCHA